jgi:hypothetical protein
MPAITPRMGSFRLSWLSNSWLLKLLSLLRALREELRSPAPSLLLLRLVGGSTRGLSVMSSCE